MRQPVEIAGKMFGGPPGRRLFGWRKVFIFLNVQLHFHAQRCDDSSSVRICQAGLLGGGMSLAAG